MAQSTPRTAFFRRYFDNGVQSSLDGIRQDLNTGLAAAVQRLTDLKTDVSVVKQDLGSVRVDVKTVDDRVAGIGGTVSSVPQLLNEVRSKIADVGEAVSVVTNEVATTTGLVGQLGQDVGAVKEKVVATATAVGEVDQQTQTLVTRVKSIDVNVIQVNENVLKVLPKDEFSEGWLNQTFEGVEFDDEQLAAIKAAQQIKKELRGEVPPDLTRAKPSDPRLQVLKSKVLDADLTATLDSKTSLPQRLALCAKMQAYALGRSSKKGT